MAHPPPTAIVPMEGLKDKAAVNEEDTKKGSVESELKVCSNIWVAPTMNR